MGETCSEGVCHSLYPEKESRGDSKPEDIGQLVWEGRDILLATNLKVQLTNLRRKIRVAGGDPEQIETVRAEGLRFIDC